MVHVFRFLRFRINDQALIGCEERRTASLAKLTIKGMTDRMPVIPGSHHPNLDEKIEKTRAKILLRVDEQRMVI